MATAADRDRERQRLNELNTVLNILREAADAEGYIPGSPVELINRALMNSTHLISLSRIRDLVTELGRLGWREEAWIGPRSVRGSKIVMEPKTITNLEVLPHKANREKFEREVSSWWVGNYHDIMTAIWTITNPHQPHDSTTITIVSHRQVKPRGSKSHWVFKGNA